MKLLTALLCFGFSTLGFAAAVDSDGYRCARNLNYEWLTSSDNKGFLSANEIAALKRGDQVTKFFSVPNSDYLVGYVFKVAAYDPELVMAVYSQTHKHAGKNGLGEFIKKSEMTGGVNPERPPNPHRVYIRQQVDSPYDDGEYTMENMITNSNGTYMFNSRLVDSTDADFSPRWADAYLKASPQGSGVFVTACNYMVPRAKGVFSGMLTGLYNKYSRERLTASGVNLLNWVNRVTKNESELSAARERLRELLKNGARR